MALKPFYGEIDSPVKKKQQPQMTEQEARMHLQELQQRQPFVQTPQDIEVARAINGGKPANVVGNDMQQPMPAIEEQAYMGSSDDPMGIGPQPMRKLKPWTGITDQQMQARVKEVEEMPWLQRNAARVGAGLTDAALGLKQIDAQVGEALHGTILGKAFGSYEPGTRTAAVRQQIDSKRQMDAPLTHGVAGGLISAVGQALPYAAVPNKAAQTFGGALLKGTASGAAQGALSPVGTGDTRTGNTMQGALGGGGGVLIGSTAGRVLRPVKSKTPLTTQEQILADKALSEGFKLTPGQATGSQPLQRLESVLEGMQGGGGKIAKNAKFNQENINQRALETIGLRGKKSVTSYDLDDAANEIGSQFDNLVGKRGISMDKKFIDDLDKIAGEAAQVIPEARTPKLGGYIAGLKDMAQADIVPFRVLQKNLSAINEDMRELIRNGHYSKAREVGQVIESVYDLAGRSLSPDELVQWTQARQQYANLMKIMDSVDEAGNINPGKLASNLKKENKRAYLRSSYDDNELKFLAEVGKFYKDKYPNSGTPARTFMQDAIQGALGAVGGAGGYALGDIPGAIGGAALSVGAPKAIQGALTSKPMNAYLTNGLLGKNTPKDIDPRVLRSIEATTAALLARELP